MSDSLRKRAEELFSWAEQQRQDDMVTVWRAHSYGVAEAAERIAKKCGLDEDKAYAAGLLHDLGRYRDKSGLDHIILGYKKLMAEGLPELARICLTHTFYPREKVLSGQICSDTADDEFLKDFIMNTEYDDYDKLIQLCDFLAGAHGVTTIERRFCSVLYRHGLQNPRDDLKALYELKEFFDNKCKMNIYELFRDEIMATTMRWGIPGDGITREEI